MWTRIRRNSFEINSILCAQETVRDFQISVPVRQARLKFKHQHGCVTGLQASQNWLRNERQRY